MSHLLIKSSLWVLGTQWCLKFIGIFSTALLVRWLMPDDFGIILKALLILGCFEIIIQHGFSPVLMKIKDPDDSYYHTSFTLNFLMGISLFLMMNSVILGIDYFCDNHTYIFLLRCLSVRLLIYGCLNPRMINQTKEFAFSKDFFFQLSHKIVSILCNVIACFYFKNFYGLLVGHLTSVSMLCLLGYYTLPFLPKFSLARLPEMIHFSQNNLLSHFINHVLNNLDRMLPAAFISDKLIGFYNLGFELASQLTVEIIYPLAKAFFPIFADKANHEHTLRGYYLPILQFLVPACTALGIGIFCLSESIIHLYAGEPWNQTIPYLQILALASSCHVFCLIHQTILMATDHYAFRTKILVGQMLISTICLLPFAIEGNLYMMMCVKTGINFIFAIIYASLTLSLLKIEKSYFLPIIIKAFLSGFVMFFGYWFYHLGHFSIGLGLEFIYYATCFIGCHFFLWYINGKPHHHLEYDIICCLCKFFKK